MNQNLVKTQAVMTQPFNINLLGALCRYTLADTLAIRVVLTPQHIQSGYGERIKQILSATGSIAIKTIMFKIREQAGQGNRRCRTAG